MKIHHWVIIGAWAVAAAGFKLHLLSEAIGFAIIMAGLVAGWIVSILL